MKRFGYRVLYWAYQGLWFVMLPWVMGYLWRRGRRQPAYRCDWRQRFLGDVPKTVPTGAIWLHAVSVGETRAGLPLVRALRQHFPDRPLLVTNMTPTGRDTAQHLFADDHVHCVYLPYDYGYAVERFLCATQPVFGIVMETEIWPTLFAGCTRHHIPLFLVNARLSEKSARGYHRVAWWVRSALAHVRGVAAQTDADAARLRALGAEKVWVSGNLKFDMPIPRVPDTFPQAFRQWCGSRRVLVAASTRDGEEALLLDALPPDFADVLVLVPRHPQRFDEVAKLLQTRGISFVRRSSGEAIRPSHRVWLGDSMGELAAYYRCADVAFIGGSLLPFGGQNLIEAAALGIPVLMGTSDFNFQQAVAQARVAGALLTVETAAEVYTHAAALFADHARRTAMGAAGVQFAQAHRGAAQRMADWIAEHLAADGCECFTERCEMR